MNRALILVGALMLQLVAFAAQAQTIATINLEDVYRTCPQSLALNEKLQKAGRELQQQMDDKVAQLTTLQTELADLRPGSDAYITKESTFNQLQAEAETFNKLQNNRIQRDAMQGFIKLRATVDAAIEQVAKQYEIDIVLNQINPLDLNKAPDVKTALIVTTTENLVYVNPKTSITQAVLDQLALMDKQ